MKKYRKILALIIALIIPALFLTACSTGGSGEQKTDINALKAKIISDLKIEDAKDIEKEKLTDLYGIDTEDVLNSACFITMGGTFPEEAVIIEAANGEALERIKECLEGRLEDVLVQSRNYDAENYALAQTCRVVTNGMYVSLFISANHADMERIFADSFNK